MWSSIVGFISEKPFTIWRNWLSNWDAWVVLKAKANTDWVMGCRWFCQKETEEQLWNLYNCTILFAACRKVHFPLCCQPLWLLNSRAVAYPAQNFTQWTKCQQNKLTFPTRCPIIAAVTLTKKSNDVIFCCDCWLWCTLSMARNFFFCCCCCTYPHSVSDEHNGCGAARKHHFTCLFPKILILLA